MPEKMGPRGFVNNEESMGIIRYTIDPMTEPCSLANPSLLVMC